MCVVLGYTISHNGFRLSLLQGSNRIISSGSGNGRMIIYVEIIPSWLKLSFERVWVKEEEIGIDPYSYSKCLSISLTHGKHIRH